MRKGTEKAFRGRFELLMAAVAGLRAEELRRTENIWRDSASEEGKAYLMRVDRTTLHRWAGDIWRGDPFKDSPTRRRFLSIITPAMVAIWPILFKESLSAIASGEPLSWKQFCDALRTLGANDHRRVMKLLANIQIVRDWNAKQTLPHQRLRLTYEDMLSCDKILTSSDAVTLATRLVSRTKDTSPEYFSLRCLTRLIGYQHRFMLEGRALENVKNPVADLLRRIESLAPTAVGFELEDLSLLAGFLDDFRALELLEKRRKSAREEVYGTILRDCLSYFPGCDPEGVFHIRARRLKQDACEGFHHIPGYRASFARFLSDLQKFERDTFRGKPNEEAMDLINSCLPNAERVVW